jgi:4-alpha-glucanotransferase
MNPKRSSTLYKEVSEENNVIEVLVSDLIDFYYKELRTQLSDLKYPRINVDGLGQFVIKEKLAEVYIAKLSKMLPTHDVSTFKAYYNKKSMEEKLQLLMDVTIKIEEERNRRKEFNENKHNESSTESNLGE